MRIHTLYERLNVLHQLIINESKFALLAYGALNKTIAGENKDKWITVFEQIQNNIRTYREEIETIRPELAENRESLKQLMESKLAEADSQINVALHESINVCKEQFKTIMARTNKTSDKCDSLLNEINSVSTAIDRTNAINKKQLFKVSEVNGSLMPLMMLGNNNELINGREQWAHVLLDIAKTKMQTSDVRRELEHFTEFMVCVAINACKLTLLKPYQ